MTRESIAHLDNNVVFRETFNSFDAIDKNGGTLIGAPTLDNGVITSLSDVDLITYSQRYLPPTGDFSIVLRGVIFSSTSSYHCPISQYDIGETGRFYLGNYNARWALRVGADTSFRTALTRYQKYDVVLTRNGSNYKIYVDGATTPVNTLSAAEDICQTVPTTILNDGTDSTDFEGSLDSVTIYNVTLTAEEQSALVDDNLYLAPITQTGLHLGDDKIVSQDYSDEDYWATNNVTASGSTITSTSGTNYFYNAYDELQDVVVVAGNTYRFEFRVKNIDASTLDYAVYDNTNTAWITASANYVSQINTSTYSTITIDFVVPASCVSARIYPIRNMTSGASVMIEDISVQEITSNPGQEVLNIDPAIGSIVDTYGNTITNTDVTVVQDTTRVMSFNGSTSFLSIPDNDEFDGLDNITVATWAKIPDYSLGGIIIVKNPINSVWQLYIEANEIKWRGGGVTNQIEYAAPLDGGWHRLVARQIGTTACLFIDGVKVATETVDVLGSSAGTINIGRYDNNYYLKGRLGQTSVQNRGWSDEDIARDYNTTKNRYGQ